jgi:hypothetical protein
MQTTKVKFSVVEVASNVIVDINKDLIEDIRGLIYGKVTSVFLKDCNKKL